MSETQSEFLDAISKGKHRKNSGLRLRKIVAMNELRLYGSVACYCCGKSIRVKESSLEHVIPESLGGRTVIENLALSHKECNEKRGNSQTQRAAKVEFEVVI